MNGNTMIAVALAGVSLSLSAGVYDDVQYLFRGTYNHTGPSDPLLDDSEFGNALYVARGIGDNTQRCTVNGDRKYVHTVIADVTNPLTGRVIKNRSTVYLVQPTYRNNEGVLCGYSQYVDATMPFYSDYANDYTIFVRFKHESRVNPAATQSRLFNFGYGWNGNCGLWVSLRGEDDNQYPFVYLGGTFAKEFKATQNSADTRLSAGKWTDLAIVRGSDKTFAIYTCAEGGRICKQTATGSGSSTQTTSSWLRLGTGDDVACNTTNTPVTTATVGEKFRGSFAKVAVWNRMLTDAEIATVFADDVADGDVIRFGVANDAAEEFAGTNIIERIATTSTDADLATDWRYFPNRLTLTSPTATVNFTMGAAGFVTVRQLQVKLTSASAAGATFSATLNGTVLLTDVAATPGTTVVADIPFSAPRVGDNQLVFTRTDTGTDPVYIDCFSIRGVAEDAGDYRGAKLADDIYASAWAWWKRPEDLNGNGKPDAQSREFPNALYACDGLLAHDIHKWSYDGHSEAIQIQDQTVTYPASGVMLENEPCLYFSVPQWTNVATGDPRYGRADLYKPIFAITNSGSYAFATRFKMKEWIEGASDAQVFGVGYGWSANFGCGLIISGTDPDNLSLNVAVGLSTFYLTGTQSLPVADRIATNKWIDVGISVSNGNLRIYTFVEGGTQMVEQGPINASSCATNNSARLVLGLNGTTGSAGVDGVPDCFRGWMHSTVLWPRALSSDEMLLAFKYPQRPDLVTVGVADGTRREFSGAAVDTWTQPANGDYAAACPLDLHGDGTYTVNFTIPAEQADRNQLFRLSTMAGSDPTAKIALELNGQIITNYFVNASATSAFSPDASGVYKIGVHREWIKSGAATLTVRYVSGAYPISVDAFSLGNGGRDIKVRTGPGLMLYVR